MQKKSLLLQTILLTLENLLGILLTNHLTSNTKLIHSLLGLTAGVVAIASAYLAYRAKLPIRIVIVSVIAVGLTFLAGVGGKLGQTNYAQGLLLMRVAGFGALAMTILCLYLVSRDSKA